MPTIGRPRMALTLIGFGEVGETFAKGFQARGDVAIAAYDILLENPDKRPAMIARMAAAGAMPADTLAMALTGASFVFSAVTADQTVAVATAIAPLLEQGQIVVDVNSAAPETKRAAAAAIEAGHGRYVEVAVMAPVAGPGLRVPMLLGGAAAEDAAARLTPLGMQMRPVSTRIGEASAMKLCRSIVIKGLEVLMVDCARAAYRSGVSEDVFASLAATFPGIDFAVLADTMAERVDRHGIRRAAEMREAAAMVEALGLDPALSRAIADAQARGAGATATVRADPPA